MRENCCWIYAPKVTQFPCSCPKKRLKATEGTRKGIFIMLLSSASTWLKNRIFGVSIAACLLTGICAAQVPTAATATTTTQVNWNQFHFSAAGTRRNPYETVLSPQTVTGLKVKWTYTTGSYTVSSPAI